MAGPSPKPRNYVFVPYGLSALGGVMFFAGWAGFGIWPLELIALVPLWAALELIARRSWRAACGIGWLYGFVVIAGGYHWIFEFSQVFSGFGSFANFGIFVVFSMYLGLQYAIQGVLYWTIRARGWSVGTAALPTLIVTEWLFPKMFPVYLGNALLGQPLLVQTADLGGPLLVSALVGVVNLAVFEALRWWRSMRRMPVAVFAATLACVAFTLVYGAVRIAQVDSEAEEAPSLEVGLVQANVGVLEKRKDPIGAYRRHLEQSRVLEQEGTLDLLIWPESSHYRWFERALPFTAKEMRQDLESPILFGGYSGARDAGHREIYNTVFLIDGDGVVEGAYDKTRLIMFGEYLPFGEIFPVLYELSPNTNRFTPGTHVAPLSLGPWRISTPVCYEDILPGLVREMVSRGNPHILINLTNDAWFGDTQAPWIHLRLAQFRAIEHRLFLLRATNSGVSAVIDPVGRIVAKTGVGTRENLRATVHMMQAQTLYGRWGDWPGALALFATIFALMSSPFTKRQARAAR